MLDRNALLDEQLKLGFETSADDISALSGQNQLRGIHAIRDQGGYFRSRCIIVYHFRWRLSQCKDGGS